MARLLSLHIKLRMSGIFIFIPSAVNSNTWFKIILQAINIYREFGRIL